MEQLERENLKDIIREVLSERSTVDVQTHKDHHLFLDECIPLLRDFLSYRAEKIAKQRQRDAAIQRLKDTALGTLVVSSVGGLLYVLQWIGHAVYVAWKSGNL